MFSQLDSHPPLQLRALRHQGAVALARVEREMLLKVVGDFRMQLKEDVAAWEVEQEHQVRFFKLCVP